MEIHLVGGMVIILVTVWDAEGGMASPTSFKMSSVLTLISPSAQKLYIPYKQYLGLISRDDLFWMEATTFIPSPEKQSNTCNVQLS